MTDRISEEVFFKTTFTEELRLSFSLLKKQNILPRLFVLSVGESISLKNDIEKLILLGRMLGVHIELVSMVESFTEGEILKIIEEQNNNPYVHGIYIKFSPSVLVNAERISSHIHYMKDVACITPISRGKLLASHPQVMAPEIKALAEFVRLTGINLKNINISVWGDNSSISRILTAWLINAGYSFRFINAGLMSTLCEPSDLLIIASAVSDFNFLKDIALSTIIDLSEYMEKSDEQFKSSSYIRLNKADIYNLCIFSNLLETVQLLEKPKV